MDSLPPADSDSLDERLLRLGSASLLDLTTDLSWDIVVGFLDTRSSCDCGACYDINHMNTPMTTQSYLALKLVTMQLGHLLVLDVLKMSLFGLNLLP